MGLERIIAEGAELVAKKIVPGVSKRLVGKATSLKTLAEGVKDTFEATSRASGGNIAKTSAEALEALRQADPAMLNLADIQTLLEGGRMSSMPGAKNLHQIRAAAKQLDNTPLAGAAGEMAQYNAAGVKHAAKLAKSTPVERYAGMSDTAMEIELRKVALENGQHRCALYVDGQPWRFQPGEADLTGSLESFFTAHDISRHLTLNRVRSSNMPTHLGEYLTGQVGTPRQLLPVTPAHYDGIIANAADKMLENSTGSYSFKKLGEIVDHLRSSDLPVGSSVKIKYNLPASDIAYVAKEGGPQTFYYLPEPFPTGHIATNRVKGLVKELKPFKVKKPIPPEVKEDSFLQKLFLKQRQNRNVRYYEKPPNAQGMQECYEIVSKKGQAPTAQRYYKLADGRKVSWSEGNLIKKGVAMTHEESLPFGIGKSRHYIVEKKGGEKVLMSYLDGTLNQASAMPLKTTRQTMDAVYTGQPYRSPEIHGMELTLPQGVKSTVSEAQAKMQGLFEGYQGDFQKYQHNIREILERGCLPADIELAPTGSLQGMFGVAKRMGMVPENAAMTAENINQALWGLNQRTVQEMTKAVKGKVDLAEEFFVAPFPPPPFGGKHFQ